MGSANTTGPKLGEMTSLFAFFCTTALAPTMVVLGASSNEQRVQVTPEKPGTNVTCSADMDPEFMKEVLDGIRGTLFGKPLPCDGQEKLCRQMECCFYKDDKEGSGLADDFGECRLQTFYVFIFGGLLLLVLLSFIICCCCLCCCRASQKKMPHLSGKYRRPSERQFTT